MGLDGFSYSYVLLLASDEFCEQFSLNFGYCIEFGILCFDFISKLEVESLLAKFLDSMQVVLPPTFYFFGKECFLLLDCMVLVHKPNSI